MEMREFAVHLQQVDDRSKSNQHRIDEMEKRQNDLEKLTSSVSELSSNQRHIEGDLKEIKADVKSLAAKPAKRWDGLVDKLLLVVAGAFIAWLLGGAQGV